MLVKDLIQMLSDFDENMEVGIKSSCGLCDLDFNIYKRQAASTGKQGFVLISGKYHGGNSDN